MIKNKNYLGNSKRYLKNSNHSSFSSESSAFPSTKFVKSVIVLSAIWMNIW